MNNNTARNYYCRKAHKSLHAERNVILQYSKIKIKSNGWYNEDKKIKGKSIIYISRQHGLTRIGCAKPCSECEKILYKHGIKVVKYTDIINGEEVICTMKIQK